MIWYYQGMLYMVPFLLIALWASYNVKSTFRKYSQVNSMRGITAAQAAQRILENNGVYGVQINRVSGELTDHYDPRTNVINLSTDVYDSRSVAAIGVACHEAGHALQHALGYTPLKLRNAIIPITNIGSSFGVWGVLLGMLMSFDILITISLILFGFTVVFQLLTLPTEFNASKRALESINSMGILDSNEIAGARKVLTAAALTYVAALATAIAQFVRILMIVSTRRK